MYASPVINFTLFGCHCQWHMILDATQPNEKLKSMMWYITGISPIREMHFKWDHCNCIWHTSFHPHLSSLASDDGRCAWLNGGGMITYKVWMLSEWLQVTAFVSGEEHSRDLLTIIYITIIKMMSLHIAYCSLLSATEIRSGWYG